MTTIPSNALLGISSGLSFISTQDLSSDASFDFTAVDSSKYEAYQMTLLNVIPSNDAVHFWMRTSSDGGSNYDSGSGNYEWANDHVGNGADTDDNNMHTATKIEMTGDTADHDWYVGSAGGEDGVSGTIKIYGPHLTKETRVEWSLQYQDSGGSGTQHAAGAGARESTTAVNAWQVFFSAGTIESGTITVHGISNS